MLDVLISILASGLSLWLGLELSQAHAIFIVIGGVLAVGLFIHAILLLMDVVGGNTPLQSGRRQ